MRHPVLILLPLLALAGCGGPPNLEKADGSFDRAAYRELNIRECAGGMRRANAAVPQAYADRLCGCIIDRLIAGSSDEELRGFHRSGVVPTVRMQTATEQCGGPTGPGTPLPSADTPVNDLPPPDGAQPIVPPPPVAPALPASDVADGPDAGAGASAPGGTRARVGSLGNYINADDYPAAALRNNQQGRVGFTLDISAAGRVTACRVTESSGSPALDNATCRIMQARARYTPARNRRGVAVADRDQAVIRWALPSG